MSEKMSDWIVKATSNSARPFPRTGEIASFANFTKSTGSFPPFSFSLFNLLRMVRLLHLELLLELLKETLRTVSKSTTQLVFGSQKGVIDMLTKTEYATENGREASMNFESRN